MLGDHYGHSTLMIDRFKKFYSFKLISWVIAFIGLRMIRNSAFKGSDLGMINNLMIFALNDESKEINTTTV